MEHLIDSVAKYYVSNAEGRHFLSAFLPEVRKSAKRRSLNEKQGLHIPYFLIASIASSCNLHCMGCYARADGMCAEEKKQDNLSAAQWKEIFEEASEIGISFILLAGGEPLLRRDVIEAAANQKSIAFPVFTNGLLLKDDYLEYFNIHRNLIPVISIEGNAKQTDKRRGEGVAAKIDEVLKALHRHHMLYALSITVTKENMEIVTDEEFVGKLRENGCGILFYIEYVPMQPGTDLLVLSEEDVRKMNCRTDKLKSKWKDISILSFPGDEQKMGGCLAAGRGFFHINPSGGAEPCPFSPYSKLNVYQDGIKNVLQSNFFQQVSKISREAQEHIGGCTLNLYKEEVSALLEDDFIRYI